MQFHSNLLVALQHPTTWVGMSAVVGSTASQLGEPYHTHGLLLSGGLALFGTLLKSPDTVTLEKDDPQ